VKVGCGLEHRGVKFGFGEKHRGVKLVFGLKHRGLKVGCGLHRDVKLGFGLKHRGVKVGFGGLGKYRVWRSGIGFRGWSLELRVQDSRFRVCVEGKSDSNEANLLHIRQSGPESGFQVKQLETLELPFRLQDARGAVIPG